MQILGVGQVHGPPKDQRPSAVHESDGRSCEQVESVIEMRTRCWILSDERWEEAFRLWQASKRVRAESLLGSALLVSDLDRVLDPSRPEARLSRTTVGSSHLASTTVNFTSPKLEATSLPLAPEQRTTPLGPCRVCPWPSERPLRHPAAGKLNRSPTRVKAHALHGRTSVARCDQE